MEYLKPPIVEAVIDLQFRPGFNRKALEKIAAECVKHLCLVKDLDE